MGLKNEIKTIRAMIGLYCRQQHDGGRELCDDCSELLDYAVARLGRCPFGDEKPTCRNCPIHCYSKPMAKRVMEVMRYAGPRMMFHHPILGIRHLLNRKKPERPPPRKR